MTKIYAPNVAYNGMAAGIVFRDGVGDTATMLEPEREQAALAFFRSHGYGIGERPRQTQDPRPDYEQVTHVAQPTSIDAAVTKKADGPVSDAFLPPTNAGEADPHGPLVVSPQVHAAGPKGIKPGDVHIDDAHQQEADETALTQRVLVEGLPHPVQEADADRGPLDASDPGSVEQGVEGAKENQPPARSASKAAWASYAVSQGATTDEAEAATRAALIERYGVEG